MAHNDSGFRFGPYPGPSDDKPAWVARLAERFEDREKLFDCLSEELQFPDYFGRNWDALYDLLCDLSWIDVKRVVLLHEGLPALQGAALSAYLEILADSISTWRRVEDDEFLPTKHDLIVVFPVNVKDAVVRLLGRTPD